MSSNDTNAPATEGEVYDRGFVVGAMLQGAAYAGVVLAVCILFILALYLISLLLPDPEAAGLGGRITMLALALGAPLVRPGRG
ncbi:MAG: RC-LH1 core complex protein PufX [Pseudomonadota bacterium]